MAPTKAKVTVPSTSPTGRRVPHGKNACARCRNNKSRCTDIVDDECSACRASGNECSWLKDKRRAVTKDYLSALNDRLATLSDRVQTLEALLRRHNIPFDRIPDSGSTSYGTRDTREDNATEQSTAEAAEVDEPFVLVSALNKLVLERDPSSMGGAVLNVYGAHSMFPEQIEGSTKTRDIRKPSSLLDLPPEWLDFADDQPMPEESSSAIEPWARNLPLDVVLTRAQHDGLVKLFFQYFTSWTLRLIPGLFWRDLERLSGATDRGFEPLRTAHYSPLLHNAILATATAFSEDKDLSDEAVREKFALNAKEWIEVEASRPTLSTVQGLTILGSYHSGRGDQGLGWLYFGMSVRTSSSLGLDLDNSSWLETGLINEEDLLQRTMAFWSLFLQDKTWSLYVGRAAAVSPRKLTLPEEPPEWLLKTEEPANLVLVSSLYLAFVQSCKLMIIGHDIMEEIYGSRATTTFSGVKNVVSSLRLALTKWYNALPDSLRIPHSRRIPVQAHILSLHLAYEWLTILLLRPFYRRIATTSPADDAVLLCNRAAHQVTRLISLWERHHHLRYTTITAIQVTFTAGTTHLLAAVHANGAVGRETGLKGVRECIRALGAMGGSWRSGIESARTLARLMEDWAGVNYGSLPSSPAPATSTAPTQNSLTAAMPATTENPDLFPFNLPPIASGDNGTLSISPPTAQWDPRGALSSSFLAPADDHASVGSANPQTPSFHLFFQTLAPHMPPAYPEAVGAASYPDFAQLPLSGLGGLGIFQGAPYPIFNELDLATDQLHLSDTPDLSWFA